MDLKRETIVEKALEILDRDGLEAVTLRRLAAQLNVKASSLYWHIKNKRDLLDEMAEVMLRAEFSNFEPPAPGTPWRDWLVGIVNRLRTTMLSHREGAWVVTGANPHRAETLGRLGDYVVSTLHDVYQFDIRTAGTLMMTVTTYTFGSVIEEQTSPSLEEFRSEPNHFTRLHPSSVAEKLQSLINDAVTPLDVFNDGLRLIIESRLLDQDQR